MFAGTAPTLLTQGNPLMRVDQNWLKPAIIDHGAPRVELAVPILPLSLFAAGTILGLQSASAADVQTVTIAGGAGTWTLYTPFGNINVAWNVPLNAGGGNLQTLLQAKYGAGNILVTGVAGTTYTLTGAGVFASGPLPSLVAVGAGGATATIVHTTLGTTLGAGTAYNGTLQVPPTAAPVMTDSAGAGTWPAGSYTGCYTYVNGQGETTPSPMTAYASAGTKKIHFATINTIPAGVTKLNYYVNGQFVVQKNVVTASVAAFDVDLADIAAGVPLHVPNANTAFVASDGTSTPVGALVTPVYTDLWGNMTLGGSQELIAAPMAINTARMMVQGYLKTKQLNVGGIAGIDANALAKLNGRLLSGTLADGLCYIGG